MYITQTTPDRQTGWLLYITQTTSDRQTGGVSEASSSLSCPSFEGLLAVRQAGYRTMVSIPGVLSF